MASRQRARNSSSLIAVWATPIRVTSGARAPSAARRPIAGSSFRAVRSPEAPKINNAHGGVRPVRPLDAETAASAVVDIPTFVTYLGYEHELSLRRRALQQFVGAPSVGQRQPLRDDRVNLVRPEQFEQRPEILPVPL